MFGIGGFELFLILLFGFLIFGPDKLPAIAKTLGRAIAKFRDAQEEMSGQLKKQSFVDKESDEPFKNPLDVIEKAASDAKSGVKSARKKADEVTDAVASGVASAAASKSGESVSDDSAGPDADHTGAPAERSASFAERKARYDKERAQRKAKEQAEQKAAQEKEQAQAEADRAAKENPLADVPEKKVSEASDDASDGPSVISGKDFPATSPSSEPSAGEDPKRRGADSKAGDN